MPDISIPESPSAGPRGRDPWSVVRPPDPVAQKKKNEKAAAPPPSAIEVCTKSDDLPDALAACTQVIEDDNEKDEQRSLAYLGRARIYYLQQEKVQTLADLNEAVRLNAKSPLPAYRRGRIWLAERNYDLAIKDFSAAAQLAPKNGAILIARATAFRGKGDFKRAIADLSRAIEFDKNSELAFYERGLTQLAAEDATAARSDLLAAATINPKFALVFLALGNVETQDSRYEEALGAYDKAIKLDPSIEGIVLQAKGAARQKSGDCFGAIADYTRAVSLGARSAQLYKGRGACLREIGELDESLADLNRAIFITPNNPEFFAERGVTYFRKKDRAAALKDLDRALKSNPGLHLALLYRARVHLASKNPKLAVADFDLVVPAMPSADVLAERAWAYILLSENDKAQKDIADALSANPTQPLALLARGYLKLSKGEAAGGKEDLLEAARRDPKVLEFAAEIGITL